MNKNSKIGKIYLTQVLKIIILGFILSFGLIYIGAWTTPTSAPPGDNTLPPLNEGPSDQIKIGTLGLNNLLVEKNTGIFGDQNGGNVTLTIGSSIPTLAVDTSNGNVGIGITSPTEALDVDGSIRFSSLQHSEDSPQPLCGSASGEIVICSKPRVSITADGQGGQATITYGGSAQIDWASTNTFDCTVSPGGWTGASGSNTTPSLTSSQTYTATCTAVAGGSVSDSVVINVAPIVDLQVKDIDSTWTDGPATKNHSTNTKTELSWTSTYATSCSASGDWSGSKQTSSSSTFTPSFSTTSDTYTYTLTCDGPGGSTSDSVAVNILPGVTMSPKAATVAYGSTATISWSAAHANSCTASFGGSDSGWAGAQPISGSYTTSPITSFNYIGYTLTCVNTYGSGNDAASVAVESTPDGSVTFSQSGISGTCPGYCGNSSYTISDVIYDFETPSASYIKIQVWGAGAGGGGGGGANYNDIGGGGGGGGAGGYSEQTFSPVLGDNISPGVDWFNVTVGKAGIGGLGGGNGNDGTNGIVGGGSSVFNVYDPSLSLPPSPLLSADGGGNGTAGGGGSGGGLRHFGSNGSGGNGGIGDIIDGNNGGDGGRLGLFCIDYNTPKNYGQGGNGGTAYNSSNGHGGNRRVCNHEAGEGGGNGGIGSGGGGGAGALGNGTNRHSGGNGGNGGTGQVIISWW